MTVAAIHEGTIQVVLRSGADRLTTVRLAQRAGVSVGTLYQYYPHRRSLLFAVLKRHLEEVAEAVERACAAGRDRPLRGMVEGVVEAYLDAKLRQRDTSVALYRIASDLDGDRLVEKVRQRSHKAVVSMLRSAALSSPGEVEFATFMFLSAIAGATRSVLEAGAPPGKVRGLRKHLVMLGEAYLGRALMLPT